MSARSKQLLNNIEYVFGTTFDIGYDQGERFSFYDRANKKFISGKEGDCSAVTAALYEASGYPFVTTGTCFTGNFREKGVAATLKATNVRGWTTAQIVAAMRPGDSVLKESQHVMIMAPNGKFASMNHDENGKLIGGKAGDQTGTESSYVNLWANTWDYILQIPDAEDELSVFAAASQQKWLPSVEATKRLQTILNEKQGSNLVVDGIAGPLTIKAFQQRMKCTIDGEIWTPSDLWKRTQLYLNNIRSNIINNLKKPSPWDVLAEDGLCGATTARAFEEYLLKWNGAFS